MIERWNHEEREHREPFAGEPFVSIDPGEHGYALGWVPSSDLPIGYCSANHVESLVELFHQTEARALILEKQYVTSLQRARSILELTARAYMGIGWVACSLRNSATWGFTLHLFEVAPSTWQAHQRRHLGLPVYAKGEAIRAAVGHATAVLGNQEEWRKATKDRKEGLASALGIGEWWRGQFPPGSRAA